MMEKRRNYGQTLVVGLPEEETEAGRAEQSGTQRDTARPDWINSQQARTT